MESSLNQHLRISKTSWSPLSADTEIVNHYSIPNFDRGVPQQELTRDIKSNKFLISQPCILISKLNPEKPRIWLIEELLPGVSVCSTEFVVLVPKKIDDLRYLYFQLKSDKVGSRLRETATGTSNSHQRVRPDAILEIDVPWIEDEQPRTEAAVFLWAIERKVQLNKLMSQTLESIVKALFNSWFIDFDPVKAKMSGEKPAGIDEDTSALFPYYLVQSDLGLIPDGWEQASLGECLQMHKSTVRAGAQTESLPYVPIDQIGAKDIFLKKSLPGLEAKTSLVGFHKNDILFGAMRPYFHKVALAPFDGTTRTTTFVLRPKNPKYLAFGLLSVFQEKAVAYATNHSQGTTIPYSVWKDSFENFPIVLPPDYVADAFNKLVLPMFEFGYSLVAENVTLTNLRDALLSRLISGELQISEETLAS